MTFGNAVYGTKHKQPKNKFSTIAQKVIMVGYEQFTKRYRIWLYPELKTIKIINVIYKKAQRIALDPKRNAYSSPNEFESDSGEETN